MWDRKEVSPVMLLLEICNDPLNPLPLGLLLLPQAPNCLLPLLLLGCQLPFQAGSLPFQGCKLASVPRLYGRHIDLHSVLSTSQERIGSLYALLWKARSVGGMCIAKNFQMGLLTLYAAYISIRLDRYMALHYSRHGSHWLGCSSSLALQFRHLCHASLQGCLRVHDLQKSDTLLANQMRCGPLWGVWKA